MTRQRHPFAKPATTYAEQVDILERRGMRIDDHMAAEFYLQHLNYYRLSAYWLPFEATHTPHAFVAGTRFTDALNLYLFDRSLRLLVLDAIERIEVSIRSQWAYQVAHRHGAHAYLDAALAANRAYWESNLAKLEKEVQRSDEVFIRHLLATYSEKLPPTWAVCEVMSLGLLSRWYGNLKPMPTRSAIASVYGVNEKVLASWLHHLAIVRNTCAHHGRLWNREFTIIPLIPKTKPQDLQHQFQPGSRRLYNTLAILLHCMDIVAPQHSWRQRLKALIELHKPPTRAMGFPPHWDRLPIWQ
ncbi:Abi family protein [Castellaniella sp.]|uniref:Abi family protein n=1 Tax=Castellaniella sp. TaxID=1955812 RepID=UPI003A951A91